MALSKASLASAHASMCSPHTSYRNVASLSAWPSRIGCVGWSSRATYRLLFDNGRQRAREQTESSQLDTSLSFDDIAGIDESKAQVT